MYYTIHVSLVLKSFHCKLIGKIHPQRSINLLFDGGPDMSVSVHLLNKLSGKSWLGFGI